MADRLTLTDLSIPVVSASWKAGPRGPARVPPHALHTPAAVGDATLSSVSDGIQSGPLSATGWRNDGDPTRGTRNVLANTLLV